jgi:uncharacterized protein YjiS (DUF1127 family)
MNAPFSAFGSGLAQVSWGDSAAASRPEKGLRDGPMIAGSVIETWRKRSRYRRHLARLLATAAELVEDIGLTVEHAEGEIKKPCWRA